MASRESTATVYFVIRDKKDELSISRKDSLLEFAAKRERTKSEAVNDISVSAVNSMASQLIDKEFHVFNQEAMVKFKSEEKKKDMKHLESSLKILKVLNFVFKNLQLFTNQGIKFLISNHLVFEEEKDALFSDENLESGLN